MGFGVFPEQQHRKVFVAEGPFDSHRGNFVTDGVMIGRQELGALRRHGDVLSAGGGCDDIRKYASLSVNQDKFVGRCRSINYLKRMTPWAFSFSINVRLFRPN